MSAPRSGLIGLDIKANLTKMRARGLMAEGVGDALEREMSVDHRFDSIDIDRPHHVLLLHAIADGQADDLKLLAHD